MSRPVLVTGASRGVGRAIVRRLVAGGRHVHGVYRRREDAAQSLLGTVGEGLDLHRADLGDPEAISGLVATLRDECGPLDGVVLCAGTSHRGNLDDPHGDPDPLVEQLRVNLEGPLRLLRSLLQTNLLPGDTSVVAIGSNLGHRGLAGKVAYAAAKGGLEGAVRSLAHELGPRGIRVNAVAPGLLRTDMTAAIGAEGFDAYAAEVPLRRVGEATDVAPLVEFLLGADAAYITGQVIDVDGGWSS